MTTCESWNANSNCQEWHNTISKDKIERIALQNARWRILELLPQEFWRTIREWKESLTNHHVEPPWRTPVKKRMIERKRSWQHKVKPCDDLDGASRWDNRESLELQKERWSLSNRECDMMTNFGKKKLDYLDETIIRITLCVSFTNLTWWQATDLAYYLFS